MKCIRRARIGIRSGKEPTDKMHKGGNGRASDGVSALDALLQHPPRCPRRRRQATSRSGESHGGHSGDDKGCGGDGGEEGPRVGFVAVCIVEPAPFTPGSSKAGSDSIDVILSQLVPLPVGRSRDSFSLLLPYHSSSPDESRPASGRKKVGRM